MKVRPSSDFAFFGAGEATYFEWAEVHVRFQRAPRADEQRAIARRVPPPLRNSIDFCGRHLMVASDRFAHRRMADAYPATEAPDEMSEDDGEFEGGRFFAASSQVEAFNRDIEDWLRAAHKICPILCAFRAEDDESDGTALSGWHDWSMSQLDNILAGFEDVLKESEREDDEEGQDKAPEQYMLAGILLMAEAEGVSVPDRFVAWAMPGKIECDAIAEGDIERLRQRLAGDGELRRPVLVHIGKYIDSDNPLEARTLLAVADLLLAQEALPRVLAGRLARAAVAENHRATLAALRDVVKSDREAGNELAAAGYRMILQERWSEAIPLFDIALENDQLDRTAYCNGLYAILEDNSKIPHQLERTRRFLARCRPKAAINPAIWLNVVCALYELGEHEEALDTIAEALKSGDVGREEFDKEPLIVALRDTDRYRELVAGE